MGRTDDVFVEATTLSIDGFAEEHNDEVLNRPKTLRQMYSTTRSYEQTRTVVATGTGTVSLDDAGYLSISLYVWEHVQWHL